jgi:DNA-binding SARP family transcriptional activator
MAARQSVAARFDRPLVLKTLGGTQLARPLGDNGVTPLLTPGKPLALLVYLAASPDRTASRDHFCDLLWADLEPDAARHSLRQTVWYLRQRLGADALVLERDGQVTLAAPIASDRDAFLSAIEKGDLECAVTLYTGDFVPDYAAPGGAEFEQWADLERFRLRLHFLRAGEQLVRAWLSHARFRDAHHLARRLRDADPARESGWRLLIEVLLSSNDGLGAAVEVEALKRRLAADNREPEPATRALLRDAIDEQLSASAPPDTAPRLVAELVGRGKEFAVIMEAWQTAKSGRGLHLHVDGTAGIGKTRLLEDAFARLRAQGAQVLLLRAKPGERQIEYAFASDLAAALCAQAGSAGISPATAGTLVALNPALSSRFTQPPDRATGAEALRRRAIALCETIAVVAGDHPLAVLLDDLHWSDPASRRVLTVILDRLPRHPVLVVTTARPGIGESFGEIGQALQLQPLSTEDVGAFVASLAVVPDAPWGARFPALLHDATGGIPLLLLDSLEWLLERGLLHRSANAWTCNDPYALEAELAAGSALRRRIANLERRPRWVLLLLAEAGTPIARDQLARMIGSSMAELEEALATLELRGLARRRGEEWEPAHDEIAESAHGEAGGDAIRAANAAVGRVLAQAAGDDRHLLFRAGRHLVVAGEDASLGGVFRRWLLVARRQGERRATRDLAAELLGNGRTGDRVRTLMSTLPLYVRLGLTSARRVAVAAAVPLALAAGAAAVLLRVPERPPDAVLVLYSHVSGDSLHAISVPVRRDGWEELGAIDVGRIGASYPTLGLASNRGDLAPSPDGRLWAFSRLVPESAAFKLFLVGSDGKPRELTDSIRDDQEPAWSPDGGSLVFSSARWSTNRWGDLAVIDLASKRVRRLTTDPRSENVPQWSPDGSRIAFARQTGRSQLPDICWTTPAGAPPVCLPVAAAGLLGWDDPNTLLIRLDSAGQSLVERYNIETHESQAFWQGRASDLVISNDRRWIVCRCQPRGYDKPAWFVSPADRPDLARRLDLGQAGVAHDIFARWARSTMPAYLTRLEITAPSDSIPQGSDFKLHVHGLDSSGAPIAVPVLAWHSTDTTVAMVDESTGVVRPVREGSVTIEATAGGWRSTQRSFVIVSPVLRPLLSEEWADMSRWVLFGDPKPTLVEGPEGVRAFWNRGDGWNVSGAHSERSFRAERGLGIEARVSTPVVGPRQQFVGLSLAAWSDSATLSRRDQSVDNQPSPQSACGVTYPAETGDNPATRGDMHFGRLIPLPAGLRSGTWYSIRLQLFPDGRCGLAINGTAVAINDESLSLDRPYYSVLEGNSLGNRMLVGPVEVWEGVRAGVDWSRVKQRTTGATRHSAAAHVSQ